MMALDQTYVWCIKAFSEGIDLICIEFFFDKTIFINIFITNGIFSFADVKNKVL